MNKKKYLFKIGDPYDDGFVKLMCSVGVFHANEPDTMIEEHVVDELFPELEELDMSDLAEGEIEYMGELDKEELAYELNERGFKTQVI